MLRFIRVRPGAVMQVEELPDGALQRLRSITVTGEPKRMLNQVNALFQTMEWANKVTAKEVDEKTAELICNIYIDWTLPPRLTKVMEFLLGKMMNFALPWFLGELEKDYQRWASGDDSREAISEGEMMKVTQKMAMDFAKDALADLKRNGTSVK
eukprot:jgi/Bigna1/132560/aug1.18_g7268